MLEDQFMASRPQLSPELRSLRARMGAHHLHASRDPRETLDKARAALRENLERAADPDGTLPPEERARRAEQLVKAHYARLAYESHKARRAAR